MAEEIKQEEAKTGAKKTVSTLFKVILGLIFLILGVAITIAFRAEIILIIKGCVGPFLILAGIVTLAIAKD